MLYLLDASVLITAKDSYYPLDKVPEYWDWLEFIATNGQVKIPREIFEEIKEGPDDESKDLLFEWIQRPNIQEAIIFDEEVDIGLVQKVCNIGYAPDLNDVEVEEIGRDPFLIAYALKSPQTRAVITSEVSKSSLKRQNRRVPDVCNSLGVKWHTPFELNNFLKFSTGWYKSLPSQSKGNT
jgi:hypothetical protein